jgi:hypothetical protein
MTAGPAAPGDEMESQISQWRGYVQRQQAISPSDVDELEHHLRDQITDLRDAGLSGDEAFLVAVKRMGGLDELSREFAREHADRLWKQLVLTPAGSEGGTAAGNEIRVVLALAVGVALAIKVPAVFGRSLDDSSAFYALNVSLFVLPFLAGYFVWKRRMRWSTALLWLAPAFVVGAVVANVYPFDSEGSTEVLVAIHLPVAMWFVVGLAYVGADWRSHSRRMDFVRFTGEWVVYYTLLAIGGGVLVALTAAGFRAIDRDLDMALQEWVLPCGAMGAVIVAAWLVEAKQNVIENIAPVLTRVFTPLATLMLLAYLTAILATGGPVDADRELLILVDLILVLVLGLILYAVSARDPYSAPLLFDRLQLVLVVAALAIDLLMLAAMFGRITELGTSPNRVAALGLNVILLVNLAWTARLLVGYWKGGSFGALERWQTTYLPVFAAWAAIVVVVFPPAFGWQ